jgi:hypothetical protein
MVSCVFLALIFAGCCAPALVQPQVIDDGVDSLAISGWYPRCNPDAPSGGPNCDGTLEPTSARATIDQIGQTCYVNPAEPRKTNYFSWFGPDNLLEEGEFGLRIYSISYRLDQRNTSGMPMDCNSDGKCAHDAIEPIRVGWNSTDKPEIPDGISIVFTSNRLSKYDKTTECAGDLRAGSSDDLKCLLNAKLISTLSKEPSSAPSATPSAGSVVGSSIVGTMMIATIFAFFLARS